jgi:hypothetical protein
MKREKRGRIEYFELGIFDFGLIDQLGENKT